MGIIDKKNYKYTSGEMYRPNPKSPPEKVNDQIKEHLTKVVKKLIAKEYRAEALDILFHSDEKVIGEFLFYYYSDKGNISCMVIDFAKVDLVKKKKLKQKKNDYFGEYRFHPSNEGDF